MCSDEQWAASLLFVGVLDSDFLCVRCRLTVLAIFEGVAMFVAAVNIGTRFRINICTDYFLYLGAVGSIISTSGNRISSPFLGRSVDQPRVTLLTRRIRRLRLHGSRAR